MTWLEFLLRLCAFTVTGAALIILNRFIYEQIFPISARTYFRTKSFFLWLACTIFIGFPIFIMIGVSFLFLMEEASVGTRFELLAMLLVLPTMIVHYLTILLYPSILQRRNLGKR
ncbi:MAG: hypothetical protein AAF429_10975 [Pseudomonadota bacterium]